jgi:pimeloyl-ACP methyl ester carboxylesterase
MKHQEQTMPTIDRRTESGVAYRVSGRGERALVFVHGFLDAATVWDDALAALQDTGLEIVRMDLAGMGDRSREAGPFSLERFAADVGAIVDAVGKPFVIVGQSMGAQVAELVAAKRPQSAAGMVLVTPVPLGGLGLPADALAPFRALGSSAEAQRQVRTQLTAGLDAAALERLTRPGLEVGEQVVPALVDAWNGGHPTGSGDSAFAGPVLIVNGASDGFVTDALIASAVAPRFHKATRKTIENAGHWPHFEQPAAFAGVLREFVGRVEWPQASAAAAPNAAPAVKPQGWTKAFAEKSQASFAQAFDDAVVLEASVLTSPIEGLAQVKEVMAAASKIYESLAFTHEALNGPRNYLEWEATAFGGQTLRGVTILTKNEAGKIVRVAIHHRPLLSALRFSAELRDRLAGKIDAGYFHRSET